jgi:hypothetical protein
MTTHIREETLQVTATEDLSTAAMRYKAITFAGTIAPDNKRPAGILKFNANSGQTATVIVEGLTKGDCSTAVSTAGWPLKVVTSGWLAAAASGDQVIGRYIGQAATASGDRIPIAIDAKLPSIWGG